MRRKYAVRRKGVHPSFAMNANRASKVKERLQKRLLTKSDGLDAEPMLAPTVISESACKDETPARTFYWATERADILDPSANCLCKSGKTYRECCLRRPIVYKRDEFNTKLQVLLPSPTASFRAIDSMIADLSEFSQLLHLHLPNVSHPYMFMGPDDQPVNAAYMRKLRRTCLSILVDAGAVDPCFFYCSERCTFLPSFPWAWTLHHTECEARQREWNNAVEEYIALADTGRRPFDERSGDEIILANCISLGGGPLFRQCARPSCTNTEKHEGEFSVLAGIKILAYCSDECVEEDIPRVNKAIDEWKQPIDFMVWEAAGFPEELCDVGSVLLPSQKDLMNNMVAVILKHKWYRVESEMVPQTVPKETDAVVETESVSSVSTAPPAPGGKSSKKKGKKKDRR